MKKFSAEFQLVLQCSSYFSDKEKFLSFKNSHQIDWNLFLSLLHRHRVLPMVCHNLHRWNVELPIKNELKTASLEHAKKALQQTATLLEINKLFTDNGIECVHFKGASLSHYLYQDPTLRQYKDIDILIERKNIDSAFSLLINHGFHIKTPIFKKEYLNHRYRQWQKDYIFEKNNCEIELHWVLSYLLDTNTHKKIFSTNKSILINEKPIKIFDDHYYLSYLILHGYYSGWSRLHWLIDIVDFFKINSIDWQKIKFIFSSCGHEKAINEVIELLSLLFSIEKPLINKDYKRIIKNTMVLLKTPIKSGVLSKYDITLQYRRLFLLPYGFKNKLNYLKTNFGTAPQEWEMLPLPKALFFLYYPLRPFLRFIRKIR